MTALLSSRDISSRVETLRSARAQAAVVSRAEEAGPLRYAAPLSSAVDGVLEAFGADEDRFTLGLFDIDTRTRGFGPKEVAFITGMAHSAKTQVLLNAIHHNRTKRVVFFTLDDSTELVLMKLASLALDIAGDELERELRAGHLHKELREVAAGHYKHLHVIDESLRLEQMQEAVDEIAAHYGPVDAVMIDYLTLIPGVAAEGYDGVVRKSQALKQWAKACAFPLIVVHQGSRSNASPGEPISMLSMGYGGEQEATFLLGVRRKRDDAGASDATRKLHQNTVTLHLVKAKRPPSKTTRPEGVDFQLDPRTGLISPLNREAIEHASDEGEIEARREAAL